MLFTSAIFMLGLVDPRSTKVSESAKGFMTLAYCIFAIMLAIIAELSIVKWDKANYNRIISSKDLYELDTRTGYWVNIDTNTEIYRLDYKTGDWLNIESNAIVDTDKIRWEEIVAELDPGDAPIIRKITYGNESLHGTRYVKVIGKDNGIIEMEGGAGIK